MATSFRVCFRAYEREAGSRVKWADLRGGRVKFLSVTFPAPQESAISIGENQRHEL